MSEYEEKYFHIRKGIIKAISSMIVGFLIFWLGIYVFEPYRLEHPNIMLVPYLVSVFVTFVLYGASIMDD